MKVPLQSAKCFSKCIRKSGLGLFSTVEVSNVQRKWRVSFSTSSHQSQVSDKFQASQSSNKPRMQPSSASSMMDIGTRQIFNEDHDIFRASVRRFMNDVILPHQIKWEDQGYVDREAYLKAGANGLLGCDVPVEYGGSGGTYRDAVIVLEEQRYINECSMMVSLHSGTILPYVLRYGTEEQKQRYLPGMVAGECLACIAMTEPGAGSDIQGIKTFAKKDGDDYILNGSKTFISLGHVANVAVVVAITDPNVKVSHGLSLFLVDRDTPGFSRGKMLRKIGLKGSDTAELFFDDVRLPRCQLLGVENEGFQQLMNMIPRERLVIAVDAMAHAEWMFETTRQYVKERKAFRRTLSALQTIQHKLAELKTKICVTRAFVDQCIATHDEGDMDTATASMAKLAATELSFEVADACVQLHGGWGYMYEMGIGRAFTNNRIMRIYGGTNEIMKEIIARPIVKV